MNISLQARERLAQQHEKYLNSLGTKKARIQECWGFIEFSGWTMERLNTLRTEVHRLSGSAGSYGLNDLGTAAQDLDRTLAMETEMSSLSPAIGELVKTLLLAFDAAIGSRPFGKPETH